MTPEQIVALRIDELSKRSNERFDELKDGIDRVEGLARETNGRVRNLEAWRERVTGAMAVASTSKPYVLAVFTAALGLAAGHFL